MGTLSALFDLTRSALGADQAALNATSNNVANANTAGYTRQQVTWTAGDSVTLSNGVQVAGSGPVVTVSSVRDRVLEQRVQQQTQAQAGTSAQAGALAQIEQVFSLTGSSATAGSTEIGTSLDSFFSSLTALAANPSDTATRAGVLSAATAVASAFNSAATQLQQVGTSIAAELPGSVAQVNTLTATIASLNAQIASQSPNGDAGTLEDSRQLAITQLSSLVGLNQISTENNGITLTTAGGTVLVSGGQSYALATATVGGATVIQDSSGNDITSTVTGGSVGGLLTAQTTDLPAVQSALDQVAYRVATAVNAQNEAGLDASGNVGGAIFAVGASASGAAGVISVVATDPGQVAAAASGQGSTGNGNANALAGLAGATDAGGATISGQFAALLANVGSQSSGLQSESAAQQTSLTQLTTQRDSLSGVSLDDEAANLSNFQRSYEASAKVLSVLDSILADAINIGEQTTVS